MARPLRIEYAGALCHVTSRGNAREDIVYADDDRHAWVGVLESVVARFDWQVHAYCLMDNHYHLFVETPQPNLSRGMRRLNGVYTQRFNRRHGRVGHLFRGRYRAVLVQRESHGLEVCRYVVVNPVRAEMVRRAQDWKWSSYRAMAGLSKKPRWLLGDWVVAQFGRRRGEAQRAYRTFVRESILSSSPWENLKGQLLLGTKEFAARCVSLLRKDAPLDEAPGYQRHAARPPLGELIPAGDDEGLLIRVHAAHVKEGYRLKEIGAHLGCHYSTVSRMVRKAEASMLHCKTWARGLRPQPRRAASSLGRGTLHV